MKISIILILFKKKNYPADTQLQYLNAYQITYRLLEARNKRCTFIVFGYAASKGRKKALHFIVKYLDYCSLTCLLDLLKCARDLFHELILV